MTTRIDEAYELVSAARDLTRSDDIATAAVWPRAAALLGRQSMECALTALWSELAPGLDRQSMRCQLLCLGPLLGDAALGGRVTSAWGALSAVCHVRVYDVAPAVSELAEWLDAGWELCEVVQRRRAATGV